MTLSEARDELAKLQAGGVRPEDKDITLQGAFELWKLKSFLKIVKKYTEPTELTPALLHEFAEKVVVHAPDKSSGHCVQRIDVHYNFIGEVEFSPEFSKYSKKTTA